MIQELSREIQIDYGHTLPDHYSFCNQIHGHRARVVAHFVGTIKKEGSERGMIIDFGICKEIMMGKVHNTLDHGFAIWKDDTKELSIFSDMPEFNSYSIHKSDPYLPKKISTLQFITKRNRKYLICDEPPTAEYLSKWAYYEIEKGLKEKQRYDIKIVRLDWWETPNNCASIGMGYPKVEYSGDPRDPGDVIGFTKYPGVEVDKKT